MNTQEYLDAAKSALGIESDYALAKELRISREYVSQFRTGKRNLSDDIAMHIADIIGKHRALVMLDIHRERAKSDAERDLWEEIREGFHAPSRRANSGFRGVPARL